MKERHFVITQSECRATVGGVKGVIKTIKTDEILPNGKKRTVHAKFQFEPKQKKHSVFRENTPKQNSKGIRQSKRRAA